LFTILLFSIGFFGLGWLVVGPILYGSVVSEKTSIPCLQEIALILVCGMVADYGLVLYLQSLQSSLLIGSSLSIFGLVCYVIRSYRCRNREKYFCSISWKKTVGIVVLCGFYFIPILTEPLSAWDARSIWFFHAKMIYAEGALSHAAGWSHPSVTFSHVDYPKLIPVLAAQATYISGFWNEYLPKVALIFMLVPAILWLFSFARRSFSFVFLLMVFPLSLCEWLWNGYMDGYFALYFSISLLLYGRYMISRRTIDIVSSVCCLLLLLNIKGEGLLAVISVITGFCLIMSIKFVRKQCPPIQLKKLFKLYWRAGFALFIWLSPFMMWNIYKQRWNLSNDLQIGSMQSLARISSRLTDGSWLVIVERSFEELWSALLILGVACVASAIQKKPVVKESLPALVTGGIYFLGITTIYLLTPYDLLWHLKTSIDRTMLVIRGCIFVGSFFILSALEKPQTMTEETPVH